jgi:hypothetical protein
MTNIIPRRGIFFSPAKNPFSLLFVALGKKGTDKLPILEDTDGDGKADKFTRVSDSLNIPIGIIRIQEG